MLTMCFLSLCISLMYSSSAYAAEQIIAITPTMRHTLAQYTKAAIAQSQKPQRAEQYFERVQRQLDIRMQEQENKRATLITEVVIAHCNPEAWDIIGEPLESQLVNRFMYQFSDKKPDLFYPHLQSFFKSRIYELLQSRTANNPPQHKYVFHGTHTTSFGVFSAMLLIQEKKDMCCLSASFDFETIYKIVFIRMNDNSHTHLLFKKKDAPLIKPDVRQCPKHKTKTQKKEVRCMRGAKTRGDNPKTDAE